MGGIPGKAALKMIAGQVTRDIKMARSLLKLKLLEIKPVRLASL